MGNGEEQRSCSVAHMKPVVFEHKNEVSVLIEVIFLGMGLGHGGRAQLRT